MHAAAYGHHRTTVDIGFILLCRIESAFRLTASLGNYHTAVDVEVLVGVDGIVVVAAGVDIAALDCQVAG